MSNADTPTLPERVYKTVTPETGTRPDAEMDVIGWSMFLALLMLMLPLLPFLAIVYAVTKLLDFVTPQPPEQA
ncbi:hypothetical protein ACFQJC_14030 [Haloferax namakaokahaiae]|uniref:Uncharacterized protein n=1 Tax=Haloferax namakaokahaiae TaxID=1748331 RepID=A0ABD5ZHQ7_9EURY